mmetsp:Transcript_46952/g.92933  ORF Transcript_46952/g.92933 Transcript_46952/m.92933 type:complete len:113 (+) Transcript_46952:438-776(+)
MVTLVTAAVTVVVAGRVPTLEVWAGLGVPGGWQLGCRETARLTRPPQPTLELESSTKWPVSGLAHTRSGWWRQPFSSPSPSSLAASLLASSSASSSPSPFAATPHTNSLNYF